MFGFTNTDWIAGYAALVSTLVVVWEVYKYYRSEKVRLTGYTASNILTFNSPSTHGKSYIRLAIQNRGSAPTVVNGVYLAAYKNWWDCWKDKPCHSAYVNHSTTFGPPLPKRLEKGDEFTSAVIQEANLVEWSNQCRLYLGVSHTMGEKMFLLRVRPIKVQKLDETT